VSQIDPASDSPVRWDAPAGGSWQLETVHVSGAQPLVFQERIPAAFKEGFQRVGVRYGIPIDYLDMRFVNDHCYARMRAVGAPEPKPGKTSPAPPALVLKVLTRVHPELRRRAKAARRALATRPWRNEVERWDSVLRDELLHRGRALQAEHIDQLDDAALVEHLGRVADHCQRGIALHMELVPVHNIPVGRLLIAGREWGLDDGDVFGLLAGSSPASKQSASALARIAAACLDADITPASLDDVRGASPAAREALDDYLADHAWRIVTQYAPRGLALIEFPGALVQAIRAAGGTDPGPDTAPDAAAARRRVPADQRGRFDALLEDARRCYGIRDDNVALTFMWPVGLLRRALLEVGGRLVERGHVADVTHAFWLGEAELAAALAGDARIAEAAADRAVRAAISEASGAPLRLGDDEGPPPDTSVFPAAMAELVDAMMVGFSLEMSGDESWSGTGVGVGTTPYTGRACVAASPGDALAQLMPGDVLVTSVTTPAFEAVMGIAGAVVTEQGSLMGHTAIQCREYGISALVGVAGATTHIAHGCELTIDPLAGTVELANALAHRPR
jgi:pyruvate,water dikinase